MKVLMMMEKERQTVECSFDSVDEVMLKPHLMLLALWAQRYTQHHD